MCAIVGAVLLKPTQEDFKTLTRVFLESKIRGMHATGISFVQGGAIVTIKKPVPADQFDFQFPQYLNEDGNLYIIGHCRYSTSDLEFNQPLANKEHSIVHNGVITQELPEKWFSLYNYNCETKNDSELVLHSPSPLEEFPDASMAVCELTTDKKLKFYRNGKRPLYATQTTDGLILTSTRDIPKRAGIETPSVEVVKDTYFTIDGDLTMEVLKASVDTKELQYDLS
jgi:glutamine phosphoribosylpyrophosphate amidotransferase